MTVLTQFDEDVTVAQFPDELTFHVFVGKKQRLAATCPNIESANMIAHLLSLCIRSKRTGDLIIINQGELSHETLAELLKQLELKQTPFATTLH